MQQKRKQTLRAGAGLLTALTLSVGLLAGCNPASFTPGQNGNPAAPVAPAAKPTGFSTLSGKASLNGQPFADASIEVFDALTGKPASIIAAGGGNIVSAGGGNLAVQADSLKTDANGDFDLQVAGLGANSVAKVVITAEGKALSALVPGSGKSIGAKAYKVMNHDGESHVTIGAPIGGVLGGAPSDQRSQPTEIPPFSGGNNSNNKLTVDERTSIIAAITEPMLRITNLLKASAASDAINKVIADANNLVDEVQKHLDANPDLRDRIITPSESGSKTLNIEALKEFISSNNTLQTKIDTAVQNTVATVANLAKTAANLQANADVSSTLNNTNFVGSTVKISVTDNVVKIGDTEINMTSSSQEPTFETTVNEGVEGQTNVATDGVTVSHSDTFEPTVVVSTNQVVFSQKNGDDDIQQITVKYKKADTASADATTPGLTGTVESELWGNTEKTIVWDTLAAQSTTLPSRFGLLELTATQNKYSAVMKVDSASVATFRIYETTDAYYLVTRYILNSSITTNSGHTTTVDSTGFTLKSGKLAEVSISSRKGATVEGYYKVQ